MTIFQCAAVVSGVVVLLCRGTLPDAPCHPTLKATVVNVMVHEASIGCEGLPQAAATLKRLPHR